MSPTHHAYKYCGTHKYILPAIFKNFWALAFLFFGSCQRQPRQFIGKQIIGHDSSIRNVGAKQQRGYARAPWYIGTPAMVVRWPKQARRFVFPSTVKRFVVLKWLSIQTGSQVFVSKRWCGGLLFFFLFFQEISSFKTRAMKNLHLSLEVSVYDFFPKQKYSQWPKFSPWCRSKQSLSLRGQKVTWWIPDSFLTSKFF